MEITIIFVIALFFSTTSAQSGDDDGDVIVPTTYLDQMYKECYIDGNGKCSYKGRDYQFLDTWTTDDCHKCVCYDDLGIQCCNMIKMPVDWFPECFPKVDRKTCKVELRSRAKPYLSCANVRKLASKRNEVQSANSSREKKGHFNVVERAPILYRT